MGSLYHPPPPLLPLGLLILCGLLTLCAGWLALLVPAVTSAGGGEGGFRVLPSPSPLPLPRTHQGNDRQRRTSSPSRPRPGETRISSTRNGVKINVDRIARYFASSVTVSGGSPNAASADCVRWLGQQKAIPMWPCGSHLVDAMRIIWRVMGHLVWRTPQ